MMKLAMYQTQTLFKKLIWLILAVLASYALFRLSVWKFQGMTMLTSLSKIFMMLTLLVAMVCMVYMMFQSWMGVENLFYSPTAYLIRTLPLSRMQIFGAYMLSTAFVWLVLLALGAVLLWMLVPDFFAQPIPHDMMRFVYVTFAAAVLEGALNWASGVFAIVFGHFKGRSGWGLIILIGIIVLYGVQFLAIGVVLLFNHNALMIDDPGVEAMISVIKTILAVYALADVALFSLSAWRIQTSAEVE